MVKKKEKKEVNINKNEAKTYAFLATFLSIIGFIIAILTKKEDKYVMFYAKQSLVIFIAYIIARAIMIIPFLGWIVAPILYLAVTVLWIFSWINALSGEEKTLWLISDFANKFSL